MPKVFTFYSITLVVSILLIIYLIYCLFAKKEINTKVFKTILLTTSIFLLLTNILKLHIFFQAYFRLDRLPNFMDGPYCIRPIYISPYADEVLLVYTLFFSPFFVIIGLLSIFLMKKHLNKALIVVFVVLSFIDILFRFTESYGYVMYD